MSTRATLFLFFTELSCINITDADVMYAFYVYFFYLNALQSSPTLLVSVYILINVYSPNQQLFASSASILLVHVHTGMCAFQ
ncbi:hypothetical protein F5Y17DRAFT_25511 [Xylariaceae sp. FL0594]|nr:hypothetical protein F5Y17DRAFT_25511 [Xylariaceae sp. FL0594]